MTTRRLVCLGGPLDRQTFTVRVDYIRRLSFSLARPTRVTVGDNYPKPSDVVDVEWVDYVLTEVAVGRDHMLPRGYRSHRALVWSGIPHNDRNALLARDDRPLVGGPVTPRRRCARCGSTNLHQHWTAMESWDVDGWSCLGCGHTWAEAAP